MTEAISDLRRVPSGSTTIGSGTTPLQNSGARKDYSFWFCLEILIVNRSFEQCSARINLYVFPFNPQSQIYNLQSQVVTNSNASGLIKASNLLNIPL